MKGNFEPQMTDNKHMMYSIKKNLKKQLPLSCLLLSTLVACNNYDFQQEFYKNEIGLLSKGSLMIYDRQVVDLTDENPTIAVVGNLSGSRNAKVDLPFAVVPNDSLFNRFNKTNFDIDTKRFAHILPEKCYDMPEKSGVIKAGERQGRIPIMLKNLGELSPDSTYFLNFKLDPENSAATNAKKSHVLIKLLVKNEFASTAQNTSYTYRNTVVATLSEGLNEARKLSSSVQLFPVGPRSVRMLAGDERWKEYKDALEIINERSIVLEVGEKDQRDGSSYKVTIKPYKTIEVVQMPALYEYPNTYRLVEDKLPGGRSEYYKEFRLHYKYRVKPENPFKEVKACFRLRVEKHADKY